MQFSQLIDHAADNFCHYVELPSTRQKTVISKDSYGRSIETVTFFKGSKILGKQVRDFTGYRYYIRKG